MRDHSPDEFRQALEAEIQVASKDPSKVEQLRSEVAFERALARFDYDKWSLKGGYAVRLMTARSRPTEDLDLVLRESSIKDLEPQQRANFIVEAVYEVDQATGERRIVVGMKGRMALGEQILLTDNTDVAGSFKHEAGHALYDVLGISDWKEFQSSFESEKGRLSPETADRLQHLIEAPAETFAELYSSIRGRDTERTRLIREHFPETLKLVEQRMGPAQETGESATK